MQGKKLLIVDDEAEVRSMFEKFLTRKGYQVSTAGDALEALRACKREAPDLVLTDFHMPEMSGVELLQELRALIPGVPVILMSGETDMRTAATALREHAFDFLSKPIDSRDLLETITRALNHAGAMLEAEEIPKDAGKAVGPVVVQNPEDKPRVVVLTFSRALDQFSQPAFETAFRRLEADGDLKSGIVIVLKNVDYINNIGLNVILQAFDRWKGQGKRVTLAQLSDPVHKYLKMLGYAGYFPIAATLEEAISSVN
ncbi:MAG: response regulator [Spirochaetia bacterium]|nr:response regulator [Spirochaetia bacterium]